MKRPAVFLAVAAGTGLAAAPPIDPGTGNVPGLPGPANAGWERLASLPEPNGGFACGVVGGEIVIAGGTTWKGEAKHWLNRIHAYNPEKNQWRETGRLETPLAYAAVGQDANAVWFASGSSGTATHRAVLKMDARPSVRSAMMLEKGFVFAGSALIGSTLYVLGGTDDQAQLERLTNRFLSIDLRTGKTTQCADYPEASFMVGALAACGDRVFAFGGARWDAAAGAVTNLSAAHAYSPAVDRWETLPPLPTANRGINAVTLDEGHILLAGGYTSDEEGFTAGAFVFDVKTSRYSPAKPLPYKAMVGLVKSGEWLYCLGGENRKKHRADAVFRMQWKELLPR